jgi:hypothetical protein
MKKKNYNHGHLEIFYYVFTDTLYIIALRIRPLTSRDKSLPRFSSIDESDVLKVNNNCVSIVEKGQKQKSFTFDSIFDPTSTQEQVFNEVGIRLVERFLNGEFPFGVYF